MTEYERRAGFADKMTSMPKYVVSTTLRRGEWNNTTVISENVAETITKLKAEVDGDILIYGSVALVVGRRRSRYRPSLLVNNDEGEDRE